MIKTKNELSVAREEALKALGSYDCRILVCSGTGCIATGSNKIYEIFADLVKETPGVMPSSWMRTDTTLVSPSRLCRSPSVS